jgi:NADPH2:quinone reductase
LKAMTARLDKALPTGNEGAGRVVQAGAGSEALLDRVVAFRDGSYSQYRLVKAGDCLPLPEGISAREGASAFINPLTVLGMVETLKREGHTALVHTAAASNVGQMLVRLCAKDGVPLVNIVRSEAQAALLHRLGAEHVVDSSRDDFRERLVEAIRATGATLAFDAIGGGTMAATILEAMETVLSADLKTYSRYGSPVHKQVYSYGVLDAGPRIVSGNFGMAWSVGGWLVTFFLQRIGPADAQRLRERATAELTTTFASGYTAEISLDQAIDPAVISAYARRATGEKYLITPNPPQG